MEDPETDKNKLLAEYAATDRMLHVFFEWRYKVMDRFFLAVAATFLMVQWLSEKGPQRYAPVAFLVGAAFSVFAALMDMVNQKIIDHCYVSGSATEARLGIHEGILSRLHKEFGRGHFKSRLSYRRILAWLYWGTAIVFVGASAWYSARS